MKNRIFPLEKYLYPDGICSKHLKKVIPCIQKNFQGCITPHPNPGVHVVYMCPDCWEERQEKKKNQDSGGDMKNKTCPIHNCEYIPCIVDVTGFTNSLDYPRTKSFPISWHMNCPYCEKAYYESVYAEWGTYFI